MKVRPTKINFSRPTQKTFCLCIILLNECTNVVAVKHCSSFVIAFSIKSVNQCWWSKYYIAIQNYSGCTSKESSCIKPKRQFNRSIWWFSWSFIISECHKIIKVESKLLFKVLICACPLVKQVNTSCRYLPSMTACFKTLQYVLEAYKATVDFPDKNINLFLITQSFDVHFYYLPQAKAK